MSTPNIDVEELFRWTCNDCGLTDWVENAAMDRESAIEDGKKSHPNCETPRD